MEIVVDGGLRDAISFVVVMLAFLAVAAIVANQ